MLEQGEIEYRKQAEYSTDQHKKPLSYCCDGTWWTRKNIKLKDIFFSHPHPNKTILGTCSLLCSSPGTKLRIPQRLNDEQALSELSEIGFTSSRYTGLATAK